MCAALCMCEIDADYAFAYNIDFEIFAFRQHIRKTGYLLDPTVPKEHRCLSGKLLDDSLINFDAKCLENRTEFLDFCCNHRLQERKKFDPIFIFPEDKKDFQSIEKKTKSEISQIILNKLEQLEDETLNLKWNCTKNKKKADLIKFFNDLP